MTRSPRHSAEYVQSREMMLELIDSLGHEERELICEYGFKMAYPVLRQFYGRWDEARAVLEAQRQALQVQRLRSIKLSFK